ncbi:MAG TPA: spirocyclase AveC family protein, partial [Acidimicrobiales bacterium]|nr:spirocyclase AveC family protein [Acidimicrobiales bacterium]
ADSRSSSGLQSWVLSVVAIVVIGNVLYGAVFAPHLVTKVSGQVTAGPTAPLFEGVPNQPK